MDILLNLLKLLDISSDDIGNVIIEGRDPVLPSPFRIGEAGAAVIAATGYLASMLGCLKNKKSQQIKVIVKEAAIAQRSHEYIKLINGHNQELWSPISGFYETRDNRWIQLHCNFPHHQQGVVDFLGCDNTKISVSNAIKTWEADILEEKLATLDLCAAMVRTPAEWQEHPQARIIESLPLMEIVKIGDSEPCPLPLGDRPLSGIKVLDLTRVIAGPVCGKTLAEHGADVMLISSPNLPSILPLVMDTGFGKRSAFIDITRQDEKNKLIALIKQADIFSQSYRPKGLAEKGFSPQKLAEMRPGIIYIDFSAYSHMGPWANRHGYDSLVQSATGIVYEHSIAGDKPKHLPAQSLDYITGFLGSVGAMEALRRRAQNGGSYLVRISLAQTAHWFKQLGRVSHDFSSCKIPDKKDIAYLLGKSKTAFGELEYLLPVLKMSETPLYWERLTVPLGTDFPTW